MWQIHINSQSNGRYSERTIEGAPHLVVTMRPIVGDTVMNQVFYPDSELTNTFEQLNNIPAPNGHPKLGGQYVPANHPVANNKHNVGGFIQNPRKQGKEVLVDFLLNLDVAERSDEGKELINRIKNGGKVGVSTGLTVNLAASNNSEYKAIASNFRFDHVAVLLNEKAAGDHVGTELVLNEENEPLEDGELLCNAEEIETNALTGYEILNKLEKAFGRGVWVCDYYPDEKKVIYKKEGLDNHFIRSYSLDENENVSLLDDEIEVVEKREFVPVGSNLNNTSEGEQMDKQKLILAIIANSKGKFSADDVTRLNELDETALAQEMAKVMTVNEEAQVSALQSAGYTVLNAEEAKELEEFKANKAAKAKELIDVIVENSDFKAEQLEGRDISELETLKSMATRNSANFGGRQAGGEQSTTVEII